MVGNALILYYTQFFIIIYLGTHMVSPNVSLRTYDILEFRR